MIVFLLIGYLMGRCGGRQATGQYPQSFIKNLKPKKKPIQPYENDPYAEAMEDLPKTKGTIEDD